MRNIKFRSWNENESKMITPFAWVNDSNLISTQMCSSPTNDLMQFTGLLDRNNVEIYEGDIILAIDDDGNEFRHQVIFIDGCFPIEVSGCDCDYDYTTMHWAIECHYQSYEVIGNIYQNKDLTGCKA